MNYACADFSHETLHPPARSKVVLRPQLIERLNEGLRQNGGFARKLILISAPAGFGKTTLLSEWVSSCAQCEPPVRLAWLSLDEGDSDLARFLVYLVTALQTIAPNLGGGILRTLQSPGPPPDEAILTYLLNVITTISNSIILVLTITTWMPRNQAEVRL